MKKFVLVVLFALLLPIVAMLVFGSVKADIRTGATANVTVDQVVEGDIYLGGNDVTIAGVVNGDAFVGASNLIVTGTINGDLYFAGQDLTLSGIISEDVVMLGADAKLIGASIGDGLRFVGNSLAIDGSSTVGGGMSALATNVTISGQVSGGLAGMMQKLTIDGTVGSNVKVAVKVFSIGSKAVIGGDIEYGSDTAAVVGEGAALGGTITMVAPPSYDFAFDKIAGFIKIWVYLSSLLLGFLLLALFRKSMAKIDQIGSEQFTRTLMWGLAAIFLSLPLVLGLVITIIGIPIGLGLLMLWLAALFISRVVFGLIIGGYLLRRFFAKKTFSRYLAMALGFSIYTALVQIPTLGIYVRLTAFLIGMGAITLYIKNSIAYQRHGK